MTTKKQKAANRRNAKKSTGPKTPEGKARSSQNRITHGLLSRQVLLKEEDPDRFREVGGQLWSELRPMGELETYLAARIVSGIWRMNRVVRIEASLFNDSPIREVEPEIGIGQLFKSAVNNGGDPFSKLRRYETAIDLGIQRAWKLLRAVQGDRLKAEQVEEEARRKVKREEAIFDAIRDRHLPESAREAICGSRETPASQPSPEFPLEAILAQGQAERGSTADRETPPPPPPRKRGGEALAGGNGKHRARREQSTASAAPSKNPDIPQAPVGAVREPPSAAAARKGEFPLEPIRPQKQPGNGAARG